MGLHVALQVELGEEASVAVSASEPLLTVMDFHVFVQVGLLSEGLVAVFKGALVWSLLSVDSQVIEEIVPLSEDLGAVLVGAVEESDDSSVLWALVLVDHEVFGAWDVLLNGDLSQVEFFTSLNSDLVCFINDLAIKQVLIKVKTELILDLLFGELEVLLGFAAALGGEILSLEDLECWSKSACI